MGIRSKLTNNITNKVGNSLLNIEEIKEKGDLPTTQEELRQRRERAETLVKKKSLLSSGASIVPIPGLDFGVDLKLMRDIIEDVNKIYGLCSRAGENRQRQNGGFWPRLVTAN